MFLMRTIKICYMFFVLFQLTNIQQTRAMKPYVHLYLELLTQTLINQFYRTGSQSSFFHLRQVAFNFCKHVETHLYSQLHVFTGRYLHIHVCFGTHFQDPENNTTQKENRGLLRNFTHYIVKEKRSVCEKYGLTFISYGNAFSVM